jgi:regulator of sigma E protease
MFGAMGILGIGLLIGIHELGHFLFAKLFNVRTPSFSIGFGPQLISKKIGTTVFSLSAIPLGGYVEVSGMAEVGQGEQKEADNTGEDSFAVKPFWQKMLILFGGIMFNILFAYFAFSLVFMLGAPKSDLLYPLGVAEDKPEIHVIRKNSAADKAGLKVGDIILAINNTQTNGKTDELKEILHSHPDQIVSLRIKRDDLERTIDVPLDATDIVEHGKTKKIGTLGVYFEISKVKQFGFFESIAQGFRATNIYLFTVIYAFKNMFTKKDISGVGGPLMVISETIKGAQKGFKIFLLFLAVISINLAILNLIPLPILDGGQIFFVTIETIIGKQLPKLREYIHIGSWLFVMALVIYLTARDIGLFNLLGLGK